YTTYVLYTHYCFLHFLAVNAYLSIICFTYWLTILYIQSIFNNTCMFRFSSQGYLSIVAKLQLKERITMATTVEKIAYATTLDHGTMLMPVVILLPIVLGADKAKILA
ncbi:hypothetical protein ACJX0J_005823, partial [Zea mays]